MLYSCCDILQCYTGLGRGKAGSGRSISRYCPISHCHSSPVPFCFFLIYGIWFWCALWRTWLSKQTVSNYNHFPETAIIFSLTMSMPKAFQLCHFDLIFFSYNFDSQESDFPAVFGKLIKGENSYNCKLFSRLRNHYDIKNNVTLYNNKNGFLFIIWIHSLFCYIFIPGSVL